MTTIIKKGDNKKRIQELLKKLRKTSKHTFNAKKYVGKLKFDKDALEIQKRLRDDW